MKRKLVNVFRSINRKRILKLKNILTNNEKEKTIKYSLLIFGSIDLFRGFMHTFLVKYASEDISGIVKKTYPIKDKNNIRTLMSVFGASNYQTGIIKILIASNNLSKLGKNILILAPIIALINTININIQNINNSNAQLPGKYFMTVYNIVSLLVFMLITI